MGARIKPVALAGGDREILERWLRARSTPQRLAIRSRIVLLLAEGRAGRAVAQAVGVSRHTVDLWRQRFREGGCSALAHDKPGRGRRTRSS
jgi:transposase